MIGCLASARTWSEALDALEGGAAHPDIAEIVRAAADPAHAIEPSLAPIARKLRSCSTRLTRHTQLLASRVLVARRDEWWEYGRTRQIAAACPGSSADDVLFATEALWWRLHGSTLATLGLERDARGTVVTMTGERGVATGRLRVAHTSIGDHVRFSGVADGTMRSLTGARVHFAVEDGGGGATEVSLGVNAITAGRPCQITAG